MAALPSLYPPPPNRARIATTSAPALLFPVSAANMHHCIVVSISGGQAAGKKTVQTAIAKRLRDISGGKLRIACLSMKDFTRRFERESEREDARVGGRDMDCIESFDLPLLTTTIRRILHNEKEVRIPQYDEVTYTHSPEDFPIIPATNSLSEPGPADVLLVEGCYMLCDPKLVELSDIKVFVDLNADARLGRRVLRDTEDRNFPLERVFDTYLRYGKPAYELKIEPTKSKADVILPKGAESAAIDLIAMGIWDDIGARIEEDERLRSLGGDGTGGLDVDAQEFRRTSLVGGLGGGGAMTPNTLREVDLERFYDPL